MHLRRALLLFAIVLGLTAIAASVSRSPDSDPEAPAERIEAPRLSADDPSSELRLRGPSRKRRAVLQEGSARTLVVTVGGPGEVGLPALGLSSPAERLTPARFELLLGEPGSYEIEFTPAGTTESRRIGTLIVP